MYISRFIIIAQWQTYFGLLSLIHLFIEVWSLVL